MNKGFIFDMDGVIIDSESVWPKYEEELIDSFSKKGVYQKIKKQILGKSLEQIINLINTAGYAVNKTNFYRTYDEIAIKVYSEAALTPRIEELIKLLTSLKVKLGLVSSAREKWIDIVLSKLASASVFDFKVSVNDCPQLQPKPAPDGYILAMKKMRLSPNDCIVIEDTNTGIKAGKSAGAFTICLLQNQPKAYKAEGADMYVENIETLIDYFRRFYE